MWSPTCSSSKAVHFPEQVFVLHTLTSVPLLVRGREVHMMMIKLITATSFLCILLCVGVFKPATVAMHGNKISVLQQKYNRVGFSIHQILYSCLKDIYSVFTLHCKGFRTSSMLSKNCKNKTVDN